MVLIDGVEKNAPAARAGILAGDWLLEIDGHNIQDVLDYRFYMTAQRPQLLLQRDGGAPFSVRLYKGEYEDAGLQFATYLMDEHRACRNKCVFCFIDQLPRGMRDSLYFKDDDSRLSFLQGNYITMTNFSEHDVDRIIEMHMSPVRVSVHTTDPALRVCMMRNKHAGAVLSYLDRFAAAGLALDCQIVLCHSINDGAALDRTLSDLAHLAPSLRSVSVVPAGLTKHRDGLDPLTPFSKAECAAVIATVERMAAQSLAERGTRVFYCADEFYLLADKPLPDGAYYEDYVQLENGVGMLTSLHDELSAELAYLAEDYDLSVPRHVSLATGTAAYPFLCKEAARIMALCPTLRLDCHAIVNHFFGESVTVAGLVTGGDLTEQLRGKDLGERLLIPGCMLRQGDDVFLDDMTREAASRKLGVPLVTNDGTGADFLRAVFAG